MLEIEGIEMQNCGQRDTEKACVRIESVGKQKSSETFKIKNSAFHSGKGQGFFGFDAESGMVGERIVIENNIFFDVQHKGFHIDSFKDGLIQNNYIIGVKIRPNIVPLDDLVGFEFCRKSSCPGTEVIGNVVAGTTYLSYWAPA
jgi:hypothetical protein